MGVCSWREQRGGRDSVEGATGCSGGQPVPARALARLARQAVAPRCRLVEVGWKRMSVGSDGLEAHPTEMVDEWKTGGCG